MNRCLFHGYSRGKVGVEGHKPRFPEIICPLYKSRGPCKRGNSCVFLHHQPVYTHRGEGLDDPYLVEVLAKSAAAYPVQPPEDPSINMLYVRRLTSTGIVEQDLRDRFSAYGEIQSIRMVAEMRGCAFITFTTRQAAEKAMDDLKTWVDLKGHKLRVLWAHYYQPERFTTISDQHGTSVDQEPMDLPQTRTGASSSSSCQMPPSKSE